MVDNAQHEHLIAALRAAWTTGHDWLEPRPGFTPYVGYYYPAAVLSLLLPVATANKIVLTAYVVALPLAAARLLSVLKRPLWPVLVVPSLAFGDSFSWGFFNYCLSMPVILLACAEAALVVERNSNASRVRLSMAALLLAAMHAQTLAFAGVVLPLWILIGAARTEQGHRIHRAATGLACLVPVALLGCYWARARMSAGATVDPGAPWAAWGPTFSAENLAFKDFAQNRRELLWALANVFVDGSDAAAIRALISVLVAAWVSALVQPRTQGLLSARLLLGLLVAVGMYFILPFDIRGYMYYLNTRYAHLVGILFALSAPRLARPLQIPITVLVVACSLWLSAVYLGKSVEFRREAQPLVTLVQNNPVAGPVLGVISNPSSHTVGHPVFLHAAAYAAQLNHTVSNFSFASTPHSPLRYRERIPTGLESEWASSQVPESVARNYPTLLVRGDLPDQLRQSALHEIARDGDWRLLRWVAAPHR